MARWHGVTPLMPARFPRKFRLAAPSNRSALDEIVPAPLRRCRSRRRLQPQRARLYTHGDPFVSPEGREQLYVPPFLAAAEHFAPPFLFAAHFAEDLAFAVHRDCACIRSRPA